MKRGLKRWRYSVLASWCPPLLFSHISVQYSTIRSSNVSCITYCLSIVRQLWSVEIFPLLSCSDICLFELFNSCLFAVLFKHFPSLDSSDKIQNIYFEFDGMYTLQYMCVSHYTCSADDKEVSKGNACTWPPPMFAYSCLLFKPCQTRTELPGQFLIMTHI